jgi:hypothetical protein
MHVARCPHAIEHDMWPAASNAVARILLLAARLSKELRRDAALHRLEHDRTRLVFRENRRDPACRLSTDEKRKDQT